MKLNSFVEVTIASIFGLLTTTQFGADQAVLAEPRPCPTYQIEGTILTPLPLPPDHNHEAEVFVHLDKQPLVRHQVFANFSGATGQMLSEPILLMTNELGRATVEVPQDAVNVGFMTESPGPRDCSANLEVAPEPVIVTATIPVQPSVDGPVGLDQGVTYDDIFDTAPYVNQTGNVDVPASALAHTGPISRWVLTLSVVMFGAGIGLGIGRGRRTASVER